MKTKEHVAGESPARNKRTGRMKHTSETIKCRGLCGSFYTIDEVRDSVGTEIEIPWDIVKQLNETGLAKMWIPTDDTIEPPVCELFLEQTADGTIMGTLVHSSIHYQKDGAFKEKMVE